MTNVVIIGGSGHVGTYLVPRLVSAGFEVTSVSRGQRSPYQAHGAWKSVRTMVLDRDAEERAGTFGQKIRDLRPDIVIDMICFTEPSARHLVEALRGQVAISCTRERSGCMAPAWRSLRPKCSLAARSANMGSARRRSRPI